MINPEVIGNQLEYNYGMADKFIEHWHESEHNIETGLINLGTIDDILKLIHKEEVKCRKIALTLPSLISIQVCMIIYGEIVYGKYKKYHKTGNLHVFAAEAIRILHYGQESEREGRTFLPEKLFELFEHIKIIVEAKELAQMVDAGILQDVDCLCLNQGHFRFSERDIKLLVYRKGHHGGKGMRLRMGTKTTELFCKDLPDIRSPKSGLLKAIRRLLSEPVSGQDISFFKGTYYEFLPAVAECDSTYREFLEELLERIDFLAEIYLASGKQYAYIFSSSKGSMAKTDWILGSPMIIPPKMVKKYLVFIPEWKRWTVEEGSRIKILETPIIKRYDGKCITSFWILGDAINSWLEEAIYRENETADWKMKISQAIENQFEEEVICFMRNQKFEAGQVEQNGVWHTGNDRAESLMITLPGEVDVLAVNHNRKTVYLIECKCLHDMLSADGNAYKKGKSINRKLSGTFVQKLKKKREIILDYVEKNLQGYMLSAAILTDLEFPVYLLGSEEKEWEKIIDICSFKEFQEAVVKNKALNSCVGHI